MALPLLTRRRLIAVGAESTAGTPVVPDTAIQVFEPVFTPPDAFEPRRPAGLYGGGLQSISTMQTSRLTFKFELRGSGTGGSPTPTWAVKLLKACGAKQATNTFTPSSSIADMGTITIYLWEDGVLKRMAGAMGNIRFSGEAGKPVMCDAEFWGVYMPAKDDAALSAPSNTPIPPRFAGVTLTLDASYTPRVSNFTFDLGNRVDAREHVAHSFSVDAVTIRPGVAHYFANPYDREPKVTLDPEADTVANYDWLGKITAGTEAALSLIVGATAGNIITLTAPKIQYLGAGDSDRGGKATLDLTCGMNASTGDDEWSIVFS